MKSLIVGLMLVLILSVPALGEEFVFTLDFEQIDYDLLNQKFLQANDWSEIDTSLEWTNIILTAIDLDYTIRGLNSDTGIWEVNPIVGKYPSNERLFMCTIGWMLLRYGISKVLPEKWRTAWQLGNISLSLYCIDGWIKLSKDYSF